ncbi:hypothetical protein SAY86_005745 [Trapa natans]|uniref:Uncharacterized protein n=1 Tax=Trapa natans TaxID=22666 RepID=A0AAN7L0J2_TRANT|nr:hypothetical protein SAY86_005745 [Trapa natans]
MGNFTSCSCSSASTRALGSASAKVLDPSRDLRKLNSLPARAAELMLEYPGHLVVSLDQAGQAGRFIALRADDELMAGKAYMMVPCNRANARVVQAEMAAIRSAFRGRRHVQKTGRGTLVPIVVEEKDDNKGGDDVDNKEKQQQHQESVSCYNRNHKPWSPLLEPIFEN